MLLRAHTYLAAISALVLLGTAAGARAESPGAPPSAASLGIRTIDPDHSRAAPEHKSLQWAQKDRWGLKLDMNQPIGRDMQLRDIQAGAYYRVTPSLRVGGSVALTQSLVQPGAPVPSATVQAPQIKLETTFKF